MKINTLCLYLRMTANHIAQFIAVCERDIESRLQIIELIKEVSNGQSPEGKLYIMTNSIQPKLIEIETLHRIISKLNDFISTITNLSPDEIESKFIETIKSESNL